jgi:hypothetical protein
LEAIVVKFCKCILELPDFKKEDDIRMLLRQGKTNAQVLVNYAGQMEKAGRLLRRLSVCIACQPVIITGDSHGICVQGPEEILKPLLTERTLQPYPYEEYLDPF